MANVLFKQGLLKNLPSHSSSTVGTIYVTTDERAMYVDLENERIRLGDFIEAASWADVQKLEVGTLSTTALYYATAENILAKWTGTSWTQINPDNFYQVTGVAKEVSGTSNNITITTKVTSQDEGGQSTVKSGAVTLKGTGATTITGSGTSVTISSMDTKVTSVDNHYKQETIDGVNIDLGTGKVVKKITTDAAGHITEVTSKNENDIVNVAHSTTASGNTATVSTQVTTTNTPGGKSDTFKIIAAGDLALAASGDTVTITGHDTQVTSVENHYPPSGGATITPTSDDSEGSKFVTGIKIDAAGHITEVKAKEAVTQLISGVSVNGSESTDGQAFLNVSITHGGQSKSGSIKISPSSGDKLSVDASAESGIVITGGVKDVDHHYTPANGETWSADGGSETAAKATTQVISGVEVDEAGHLISISSVGIKDTDTHANIASVTGSNQSTGFGITVADTDGISKMGTINPSISYGVNNQETKQFENGVATLNIYTKSETDDKIEEAISAANAIVLRGEVDGSTKTLPTTNVSAGDAYIVTSAGVVIAGEITEAGDLFVAKIDKASGVVATDWYYVPAGNDKHVVAAINTTDAVGAKLIDGNNNASASFGSIQINNTDSASNIKAKIVTTGPDANTTSGAKDVHLSLYMEWGTF